MHEEGRLRRAGSELAFEYYLGDHASAGLSTGLGNTRVMFGDNDGDGIPEALQEDHYYPFGLKLADGGIQAAAPAVHLYNGKELQDELGLGWYDYGARMYSPTVGRWNGVDRFAEKYLGTTPFAYVMNNPLIYTDPTGDTIRLADNFRDNEYLMAAYNTWLETDDGKEFVDQFGKEGKYGHVLVKKTFGELGTAEQGETVFSAVDNETGETRNLGSNTDPLKDGERLQVSITLASSNEDGPSYLGGPGEQDNGTLDMLGIALTVNTLIHEHEHVSRNIGKATSGRQLDSPESDHAQMTEGSSYDRRRVQSIMQIPSPHPRMTMPRYFYNIRVPNKQQNSFEKWFKSKFQP